MKNKSLIIWGLFLFGLFFWLVDAIVDTIFFSEEPFINMLLWPGIHELYFRSIVIVFFTIFGVVLSRAYEKRVIAEKALRKAYNELEQKVADRTKKLKESNEILNGEINDRVHAEFLLAESEKLLEATFNGISDPLLLVNKSFGVLKLNKAALSYYKLDNYQDLIGKKCHHLIRGQHNPCEGCEIPSSSIREKPAIFERNGIFDPKVIEKVVVYPICYESGEVKYLLIRIVNITERKKIEETLIQNEKMAALGILVPSIAHEINNPNNFISFNMPILREYIQELMPIMEEYEKRHPNCELCNMSIYEFQEDFTKIIDNIENGSKRISAFVNNLKDYSYGKFGTTNYEFDIRESINRAYSICKSKLHKHIKSFNVNVADDFPKINADPVALEQILISLMINAAEAANKEDAWIKISAQFANGSNRHITITIQDNGLGIDEKTKKRIFEPFFSSKEKNSGLGLFSSYNLAQKLSWQISVESEIGKGSTFKLFIPINE